MGNDAPQACSEAIEDDADFLPARGGAKCPTNPMSPSPSTRWTVSVNGTCPAWAMKPKSPIANDWSQPVRTSSEHQVRPRPAARAQLVRSRRMQRIPTIPAVRDPRRFDARHRSRPHLLFPAILPAACNAARAAGTMVVLMESTVVSHTAIRPSAIHLECHHDRTENEHRTPRGRKEADQCP